MEWDVLHQKWKIFDFVFALFDAKGWSYQSGATLSLRGAALRRQSAVTGEAFFVTGEAFASPVNMLKYALGTVPP